MKKTSVYLSDEEAILLASFARILGRSQADLIREGIALVTSPAGRPTRVFHSRGVGQGDGTHPGRWTADEIYSANVRMADEPTS